MVSLGDKQWQKCINCYKVRTHYHNYTESYTYENNATHKVYCECDEYILEEHNVVENTCTECISHIHNYTYNWISLTQHKRICECVNQQTQSHVVSASDTGSIKTCLQCGGRATFGFIQY